MKYNIPVRLGYYEYWRVSPTTLEVRDANNDDGPIATITRDSDWFGDPSYFDKVMGLFDSDHYRICQTRGFRYA